MYIIVLKYAIVDKKHELQYDFFVQWVCRTEK